MKAVALNISTDISLFICGLFDHLRSSDYVASSELVKM
jgi:hypothetical protein